MSTVCKYHKFRLRFWPLAFITAFILALLWWLGVEEMRHLTIAVACEQTIHHLIGLALDGGSA